ncbi:hypothetical protein M2H05_23045 [Vibrio vulnificus]|nr:hypothetical protein [Vibrio vulnificus]MCU8221317.1 hypothetical protein [Vibrio vulnificus]
MIKNKKLYAFATRLRWQLPFAIYISVSAYLVLKHKVDLDSSLINIAKSDALSFTAGVMTVLALFCSVCFAFTLHHMQNGKSERLTIISQLMAEICALRDYVFSTEMPNCGGVCERLALELSSREPADFPYMGVSEEHEEFHEFLEQLDDTNHSSYLKVATYIGNVEKYNSALFLAAVKQITSQTILSTLAKGLGLVCLMLVLYVSLFLFNFNGYSVELAGVTIFVGIMTVQVFIEFTVDVWRFLNEDLDFVDWERKT